jgi:hypothetical protein
MAKKKAADTEQNETSENGRHSSATGSDWQKGDGERASDAKGSDWVTPEKKEDKTEGE